MQNNRQIHRSFPSPVLVVLLSVTGCVAESAAPLSGGSDPDAFSLDGPTALAVHAPTGLGLSVGAMGASLELNGVDVGFHTVGWGDSQGLDALGVGDLELLCETQEGCDRAVAVHHAGLSEVWEAHPAGFEQSWVVDAPRGDDHQLVLEIEVEGASLRQIPGQTAIWLDVGEGPSVQYDGLHVLDADGVELSARLEVEGDRIRVISDVADARWPVVVDPVVTTAEWMGVGSSTWDTYGHAVSSGDYNGDGYPDLAVSAANNWGCPSDSPAGVGKVYVIYGSGAGLGKDSTLPTTTISSPGAAKCFGHKLATGDFDGDVKDELVIGSPGNDSFRGSVYIYKWASSGLSTSVSTTLTGITAGDEFGTHMATGDLFNDGYDDLAVGADKYSSSLGYVRLYRGPTPTLCRTLTGATASGRFGEEVELADVGSDGAAELLVGAVNASKVWVYTITTCSSTRTPSYTTLTTPTGLRYFGDKIEVLYNGPASYADIVVMGETSGGVGRVYRFPATTTGIGTTASSTYLSDGVAGSQFGIEMQAVDLSLDAYTDLAVSARLADSGAGRVYVYDNIAGTLSTMPTTLYGPVAGGHFGAALTRMEDMATTPVAQDLVVGAQYSSVAVAGVSKDTNGAAYVYPGY